MLARNSFICWERRCKPILGGLGTGLSSALRVSMRYRRKLAICSSLLLHRELQISIGQSSGANVGVAGKISQETCPVKSRSTLPQPVFSVRPSMKGRFVDVFRFWRCLPYLGFIALLAVAFVAPSCAPAQQASAHRPPAAPLIANDPYFSVWSMAVRLTDVPTKHWSEVAQPLTGLIRIDGRPFRWMGTQPRQRPGLPRMDAVQQDA